MFILREEIDCDSSYQYVTRGVFTSLDKAKDAIVNHCVTYNTLYRNGNTSCTSEVEPYYTSFSPNGLVAVIMVRGGSNDRVIETYEIDEIELDAWFKLD